MDLIIGDRAFSCLEMSGLELIEPLSQEDAEQGCVIGEAIAPG